MSDHVIERISAYLDGELEDAERSAVADHLDGCAACAAALDDLRRLVSYARSVPARDAAPARDLWPGIRARIAAPRVVPFEASTQRAPRRVSLSLPQLAAAAAVLIAVSAASAWFLRGGGADPGAVRGPAPIQAELEPAAPAGTVRLANFADPQYDAAVADLERALAERRNDLHPRTVDVLERNLRVIDEAIAQARQALEDDPANAYLTRHLVDARRRKLDLLRRAAAITEGD